MTSSLLLILLLVTSSHYYSHSSIIVVSSSRGTSRRMIEDTKISVREGDDTMSHARRGSKVAGLSQFKRYLSRFGYLQLVDERDGDDEFDGMFESALMRYQRRLGLQVTGRLDSNTLSQMTTPRCGVADHVPSTGLQHFVYFPGKPRWSRAPMPITLTYAFSPDHMIHRTTLTMPRIRTAFHRAFSRWAKVIPITFVESDADYAFADIKIGFYSGDHGDGEPFDGVLGVLAHSFSPESGRLHLDAAETWAVDFGETESEVAVDLESVATHEIGHVLGLSHSCDKEAVMYPSLRPREKRADLNMDDIRGVQSLYGSNPNFTSHSPHHDDLQSDISANGATRSNTAVLFFFNPILLYSLHLLFSLSFVGNI